MRILYHHRTQMGDAQGIHIQEMVNAFSALGHDVRLFSLVGQEQNNGRRRFLGALARIAPAFLYELLALSYNAMSYHRIRRLMQRYRPDFIYERYSLFSFGGVLAARQTGIPLCLEVNAPLFFEHQKYGRLVLRSIARRIENWVCNNSNITIAVSSVLRDILVDQGVRPSRIVMMPNGINPGTFLGGIDGEPVKEKLGIEKRRVVIGVVGWFREWHGLDLLIDSLWQAGLFAGNGISVLLVGDGPALPFCREQAKTLGVEPSIVFTGAVPRDQIPGHIAAIDIAVQPRVTAYACPMKVIEYLAMGKAIVAPRQPNIMDLLEHGKNALLFQPEDGRDLACQIKILIEDAPMRHGLAHNALRTVEEKGLNWMANGRRVVEMMLPFCKARGQEGDGKYQS